LRDYKVGFHFSGAPIEESISDTEVQPSPTQLIDRQPDSRPTHLHQHRQQQPPQLQRARESLRQAWVSKCYRCGELENKSNECPKKAGQYGELQRC